MFKQIPKSNISNRSFKVYKSWSTDDSSIPVITAFTESGDFNVDTFTQSSSLYVSPLYNSIKAKYYESNGNTITQFGTIRNDGYFTSDRVITDSIQIIPISQSKYGEQIKKGSAILVDNTNGETYYDDSKGNISTVNPIYVFQTFNAATNAMQFTANGASQTAGVTSFEVINDTGINSSYAIAVFTVGGITDSYYVARINFQTNEMEFSDDIIYNGIPLYSLSYGNIFYDDGLIVMTMSSKFESYNLTYKSEQSIYETEVLVTANAGEFNYSQNPSAITVTLNSSSSFETTPVSNQLPAGTVIIKDVQSITRKPAYYGTATSSLDTFETGSWDDYIVSASADPTGSYLTPFITTIGLYDETYNMVAVAKLPKPIKKLPDYNVNFIIRIDL